MYILKYISGTTCKFVLTNKPHERKDSHWSAENKFVLCWRICSSFLFASEHTKRFWKALKLHLKLPKHYKNNLEKVLFCLKLFGIIRKSWEVPNFVRNLIWKISNQFIWFRSWKVANLVQSVSEINVQALMVILTGQLSGMYIILLISFED